jgi:hypothetical protein
MTDKETSRRDRVSDCVVDELVPPSREENETVKRGETPTKWEQKPAKNRPWPLAALGHDRCEVMCYNCIITELHTLIASCVYMCEPRLY